MRLSLLNGPEWQHELVELILNIRILSIISVKGRVFLIRGLHWL